MDLLLLVVTMPVFLVVLLVTLANSRKYSWLVTPAVFYATLIFFVVFFGNMMLTHYFADYAHFFNFVKEVMYIPPLFGYCLLYVLCFFGLLFHSKKIE